MDTNGEENNNGNFRRRNQNNNRNKGRNKNHNNNNNNLKNTSKNTSSSSTNENYIINQLPSSPKLDSNLNKSSNQNQSANQNTNQIPHKCNSRTTTPSLSPLNINTPHNSNQPLSNHRYSTRSTAKKRGPKNNSVNGYQSDELKGPVSKIPKTEPKKAPAQKVPFSSASAPSNSQSLINPLKINEQKAGKKSNEEEKEITPRGFYSQRSRKKSEKCSKNSKNSKNSQRNQNNIMRAGGDATEQLSSPSTSFITSSPNKDPNDRDDLKSSEEISFETPRSIPDTPSQVSSSGSREMSCESEMNSNSTCNTDQTNHLQLISTKTIKTLSDLPPDIIRDLTNHLSPFAYNQLSATNKEMNKITKSVKFYENKYRKFYGNECLMEMIGRKEQSNKTDKNGDHGIMSDIEKKLLENDENSWLSIGQKAIKRANTCNSSTSNLPQYNHQTTFHTHPDRLTEDWYKEQYLSRFYSKLTCISNENLLAKPIDYNFGLENFHGVKKIIICKHQIYCLTFGNKLKYLQLENTFKDDKTTFAKTNLEERKWLTKVEDDTGARNDKVVIDATTDKSSSPSKRRYLYVLSQSEELQEIGRKYLEKQKIFDKDGKYVGKFKGNTCSQIVSETGPENLQSTSTSSNMPNPTKNVKNRPTRKAAENARNQLQNNNSNRSKSKRKKEELKLKEEKEENERNAQTWDQFGQGIAGDRIDVFDENPNYHDDLNEDRREFLPGKRIFNMSFDNKMRFSSLKMCKSGKKISEEDRDSIRMNETLSPSKKNKILEAMDRDKYKRLLTVQCVSGQLYQLDVYEHNLANLGPTGMQVTLNNLTSIDKAVREVSRETSGEEDSESEIELDYGFSIDKQRKRRRTSSVARQTTNFEAGKSTTKEVNEKIEIQEVIVGPSILAFLSNKGHLFISCNSKGDLLSIFGPSFLGGVKSRFFFGFFFIFSKN